MAKRVLKKKEIAEADIDEDIYSKRKPKQKRLSKKDRKEKDELLNKFREDYTSFGSSAPVSSDLDFNSDFEIQEYLDDEFAIDSGFGNGRAPKRAPASTIVSRKTNGLGFYIDAKTEEIVKTPTVSLDMIPNSGFAGTGINTGNNNLEELTQITLYGTLADDLSLIDPDTVEVYGSDKSKLALQINSLVQNKVPFVIKNKDEIDQKILVKFNEFGGYNLFVKDETSGKYKPATETNFDDSEYEAFYKNVQKAFNQNFIAKFTN